MNPENNDAHKTPHTGAGVWMFELWNEMQATQRMLTGFTEELKTLIPNLETKFDAQQKSLAGLRNKRIEIRQAEIKLLEAKGIEERNALQANATDIKKSIDKAIKLHIEAKKEVIKYKLIAAIAIGIILGFTSSKIFAGENNQTATVLKGEHKTDYKTCANLQPNGIYGKIVRQESGGNQYAIGVVNGSLQRQPKNLAEAVATADYLEKLGRNYSVGQHQINKQHFQRLGWKIEDAFDVCNNALAGRNIFNQCYNDAIKTGYSDIEATRAALSCYYSGDFKRGTRLGYSDSVLAQRTSAAVENNDALAIPLRSNTKQRPKTSAKAHQSIKDGSPAVQAKSSADFIIEKL